MKKLILPLFLALTAFSFSQVPSYVPTSGLVAFYPFNGNAVDESGGGHDGAVNGASLTTDRNSNVNSAYNFNGSTDNIVVANSTDFNMGTTYTVSVWFNISSYNQVNTLINKNTNGNGAFDYFNIGILDNTWNIYSQFGNGTNIDNIVGSSPVSLNDWHHACLAVGDSVALYFDGVLVGKHLRTIDPYLNTDPVSIGAWITQSHTYHDGKIDEVGIWNWEFGKCEIADLYNGQLGSLNTAATQTVSGLDSYTWPVNGQTYTQSGISFAVIPNAAGCDSTITLDLTLSFTGVEENGTSNFTIYPNPANDVLNVVMPSGADQYYIVLDSRGRKVIEGKLNGAETQISLKILTPGAYILQIGEENVPVRIIKE